MNNAENLADNIPDFLIEAENAVNAGDNKKAENLLTETAVEEVCAIPDANTKTLSLYIFSTLLFKIRQLDRAENLNKKILELGQYSFAYYELSRIEEERCNFISAVEYAEKALKLEPGDPKIFNILGGQLISLGKSNEGIEMLRKAVQIAQDDTETADTLLYSLHYKPDISPQTLFHEHIKWGKNFTSDVPLKHTNTPEPDRKLRIGYVSPNFNQHSVAYFFEPVLESHNRSAFEIFGYNNSKETDRVTKRMRPQFDNFKDIHGLTDQQAADTIARDKIDILVDLAGHTAGGRLAAFTRKPAPIQVTWLGYPDTTGLSQMDYRITDELADPPDNHKYYTESQICLPTGFLCYRPPDFAPPLAECPCVKNGFTTFGSFNINQKINLEVMSLWSQILKRVENSRLILKIRGGQHTSMQEYYFEIFEKLGVQKNRIEIHGHKSPAEHLELYNRIDIGLDTFPYNGTTTTCEALWMGVPVISLVGDCHSSRVSLSLFSRLDMTFFAAQKHDEYVNKACALAAKQESLSKIRQTMRQRMSASILCDRKKFTQVLELAYRKIWQIWCKNINQSEPGA
ncbi:MAG: hypothetical protein LLF92_01150 [Planctomycetaceae bacterium]|nr:hypothetical protein [Planctomycetaceae bacterium]